LPGDFKLALKIFPVLTIGCIRRAVSQSDSLAMIDS
jgi:hypothetical protein